MPCSDPPLLHLVGPIRSRGRLSSAHDARVNRPVAQGAMLETERLEFLLESLVLACLAGVVLLGKDTLARGYARREVTAAFVTVDVELGDHCVAVTLRALHLLAGPVGGRVSGEQLDR